jgi:hypothetical protein
MTRLVAGVSMEKLTVNSPARTKRRFATARSNRLRQKIDSGKLSTVDDRFWPGRTLEDRS